MGIFGDIGDTFGDIAGTAKKQLKPLLPHNAGEALLALTPGGGLLLPSLHKSKDIAKKADENEKFQKTALRKAAIDRAMGGNRLGRPLEPPKPLDLSDYAATDTIQSILANLIGKKLGM